MINLQECHDHQHKPKWLTYCWFKEGKVLKTLYLLVCISTGLQQPKQAESLSSACREMSRRLSGTIQTSVHRKPAFKEVTHAVQLNGYLMKQKQHLNLKIYRFLIKDLKRVLSFKNWQIFFLFICFCYLVKHDAFFPCP